MQDVFTSYSQKLRAIVDQINRHKHSKSSEVLREVINGLEKGVVSGLLFTLDDENFKKVIDLLCEFRTTGRDYNFNTLHAQARQQIRYD